LKDWYTDIKDKIFENLCELIPIPDCPDSSVQNCEEGLRDLLEIRDVLNYHIRATRKELQRRKDAGNPFEDKPWSLEEFLRERRGVLP